MPARTVGSLGSVSRTRRCSACIRSANTTASDGFVKTVFDASSGELLGAHLIGAEVTELIQGFVVAMGLETTEAELMHTVFAHPTLSEALHESVLDAWGRALHI